MKASLQLKVSEEDIDELGHVNNAVYVTYLEEGREAWYKQSAGMSFADMMEKALGTVVVKLEISFIKEAVLGDELTVVTTPETVGTKSFVLKQQIFNSNDEIITEAIVTSVMFNLKNRKSIPVIEEIRNHFI